MKLYKTQMSGSIRELDIYYKFSNEVIYPYNLLFDVAAKRKLLIVVHDEVKFHRTLREYITNSDKEKVNYEVGTLLSSTAAKYAPTIRDMYVTNYSAKEIARMRNLSVNKVLSARSSAINKMSKGLYKYTSISKEG